MREISAAVYRVRIRQGGLVENLPYRGVSRIDFAHFGALLDLLRREMKPVMPRFTVHFPGTALSPSPP